MCDLSAVSSRADAAAVLLIAGAGLLIVSLCAPWAHATEGIALEDGTLTGWEWFPGASDAVLGFTAGTTLFTGALRAATARCRPLLLLSGATLVGLEAKSVPGPPLAAIGLGLCAAGLFAARRPPARGFGGRAFALLGAATLLAASTFARWSWTQSDNPADAWSLYRWADVGLVLLAVTIFVAAALRPMRRLWVLPVLCLLLPFLDAGVSLDRPGGFHEPLARAGNPIGIGVAVALSGLALATSALARRSPMRFFVGPHTGRSDAADAV